MSQKNFAQCTPGIGEYVESLFQPIDAALAKIQEDSILEGLPAIQVGPMDGRHLEILARLVQPLRAVEIGTLGGYSGLCLARAMASGGVLHCFEKNHKHAVVAERNLRRAIDSEQLRVNFHIHVGPALENLSHIEGDGPFDLVFIDADKPGYPAYLQWAARHLRIGGVVIGDNTFAWGEVHRANEKTGNDRLMVGSLDEFNRQMAGHPEFRATIFPTAEGLTVGVKIR
jgi:caffeoyl-CoA O-methyltransferase